MNIALPPSLIGPNEDGDLQFIFYVQLAEGFLPKALLELAVEVGA